MSRVLAVTAALAAAWLLSINAVKASDSAVAAVNAVRFEQNLGAQVPLDVELRDASGRDVLLGELLGNRPAVLVLAYYECPMLCTMVIKSLVDSARELSFNVGEDYDVIIVSIDQRESHELAARKKASILKHYGREGSDDGWHLLTAGRTEEVRRIADAVGYHYAFDERSDQYAHPAGLVLLTPEGVTSQYFLGLDYPPQSLRLGLVDASQGNIGTLADQVLLRCFQFDPMTGQYTVGILNVLRLAGVLTLTVMGTMIFFMIRVERRRKRIQSAASATGEGETC